VILQLGCRKKPKKMKLSTTHLMSSKREGVRHRVGTLSEEIRKALIQGRRKAKWLGKLLSLSNSKGKGRPVEGWLHQLMGGKKSTRCCYEKPTGGRGSERKK